MIDFEELAHVIMEAGKFKISSLETQEELMLPLQLEGNLLADFPLLGGWEWGKYLFFLS